MENNNIIAAVTGAARGIGLGIVNKLHNLGLTVILIDLKTEAIHAGLESIEKSPDNRLILLECDVARSDAVERLFAEIKAKTGQLDILVNNAGITRDNLFMRMKPEQWQSVIDVNLSGTFFCSRYAVNLLRKSKRGRIINISSVAAKGNAGQANYASSKAGVIGLTKTLALELARYRVTVNAIAPGFIETEMTRNIADKAREAWLSKIPANRPGTVEDVANAAAFLASAEADYITGQIIGVDGGLGI